MGPSRYDRRVSLSGGTRAVLGVDTVRGDGLEVVLWECGGAALQSDRPSTRVLRLRGLERERQLGNGIERRTRVKPERQQSQSQGEWQGEGSTRLLP